MSSPMTLLTQEHHQQRVDYTVPGFGFPYIWLDQEVSHSEQETHQVEQPTLVVRVLKEGTG